MGIAKASPGLAHLLNLKPPAQTLVLISLHGHSPHDRGSLASMVFFHYLALWVPRGDYKAGVPYLTGGSGKAAEDPIAGVVKDDGDDNKAREDCIGRKARM